MKFEFTIPLRTGQGLNARLHWAQRYRRSEKERKAVAMFFPFWAKRPLPVEVTLTRVGPGTRPMDDDNLTGSLKAVRDAVAAKLGVDDGNRELIRFRYEQQRGPWAVKISIEERA